MAPVYRAIEQRLAAQTDSSLEFNERAFYVINPAEIKAQYAKWTAALPRVRPFYAVKCNPDKELLLTLKELGAGFDCASAAEIDAVLELGVSPNDIIYANPCKLLNQINHAKHKDVKKMTFDNEAELHKIKRVAPDSKLVLRIYVDDSSSICRLSVKFGASLIQVPKLMQTARALGLDVCGISFHVGSGCMDVKAFATAVKDAKTAFEMGTAAGHQMELLDIGGGFPGHMRPLPTEAGEYPPSFEETTSQLAPALDKYFPAEDKVTIISEPGRFFATASHTLLVNVFAKRDAEEMQEEDAHTMYYVNDGVYGSFNCQLYDHATVMPELVVAHPRGLGLTSMTPAELVAAEKEDEVQAVEATVVAGLAAAAAQGASARPVLARQFSSNATDTAEKKTHLSSIWGPTCDGLDCIVKSTRLPNLKLGQWLMFRDMGAYTAAAGSNFNGFNLPETVYLR